MTLPTAWPSELPEDALEAGRVAVHSALLMFVGAAVAAELAEAIAAALWDGVEDPDEVCRHVLAGELRDAALSTRVVCPRYCALAWTKAVRRTL